MRKQELLRDIIATHFRAVAITRQECKPGRERGSVAGGRLPAATGDSGGSTAPCSRAEPRAPAPRSRAPLHVSHLIHGR